MKTLVILYEYFCVGKYTIELLEKFDEILYRINSYHMDYYDCNIVIFRPLMHHYLIELEI